MSEFLDAAAESDQSLTGSQRRKRQTSGSPSHRPMQLRKRQCIRAPPCTELPWVGWLFVLSSCRKPLISLQIFLGGAEGGAGRPQIHSMAVMTLLLNDLSLKLNLTTTSDCFSHQRFPALEFCILKSCTCLEKPEVLCALLLYSAGFFFSIGATWGSTTLRLRPVI